MLTKKILVILICLLFISVSAKSYTTNDNALTIAQIEYQVYSDSFGNIYLVHPKKLVPIIGNNIFIPLLIDNKSGVLKLLKSGDTWVLKNISFEEFSSETTNLMNLAKVKYENIAGNNDIDLVLSLNGEFTDRLVISDINANEHFVFQPDFSNLTPHPDYITDVPTPNYVTPPNANANSTALTRLNGKFSVSNQGAAEYRIPMELPKGIGNYAPNLSISYSSLSTSNILGQGWSHDAVSKIHRCHSTLEVDGYFDGIDFDSLDSVCLNGKKLVLVNGEQLDDNAEYRLEGDPTIRVIQEGYGANAKFTLHDGSGDIVKYGESQESRSLSAQHSNLPYEWYVSYKTNRFNRTISYNYFKPDSQFPIIDYIEYSGNKVDFIYEARVHNTYGYDYGNQYNHNLRVSRVDIINHEGQTIFSYHFDYKVSEFSGRDLLASVSKCNDIYGSVCSIPNTFNYSDNVSKGFNGNYLTIDLTNYQSLDGDRDCPEDNASRYCLVYKINALDVDNDGSQEIIVSSRKSDTGKLLTFKYNNESFDYLSDYSGSNQLTRKYIGHESGGIVIPSIFQLSQMNQCEFFEAIDSTTIPISSSIYMFPWQFIDIDGDDKYSISYDQRNQYYDWDGDGFVEENIKDNHNIRSFEDAYTFNVDYYREVGLYAYDQYNDDDFLLDYNNDGLVDRLIPFNYYYEVQEYESGYRELKGLYWLLEINESDNSGYRGKVISEPNVNENNYHQGPSEPGIYSNIGGLKGVGDVNGDGHYEYFGRLDYFSSINTSTGIGLDSVRSGFIVDHSNVPALSQRLIALVDINNDGLDDAVYYYNNRVYWHKSLGNRFAAGAILSYINFGEVTSRAKYIYTDIDGDEQVDLVYYDSLSQKVKVAFDLNSNNTVQDKLTSIDIGFDKHFSIDYERLSDKASYTAGVDSHLLNLGKGSKVSDVTSNMPIVTQVIESKTKSSVGSASSITSQYYYNGLKYQAGGRGSLGFYEIRVVEVESGLETIKKFNQVPSFIGLESSVKKLIGNHVIYESETTEWFKHEFFGGKLSVVLPKVVVERSYSANSDNGSIYSSTLASETTTTNVYQVSSAHYPLLVESTSSTTSALDGVEIKNRRTYSYQDDNYQKWWIRRPTNESVSTSRNGQVSYYVEYAYEYDTTSGAKIKHTRYPSSNNISIFLTTAYEYDLFGNVTGEISCSNHYSNSCSSTESHDTTDDPYKVFRVSLKTYDIEGRYLLSDSNKYFDVKQFYDYDAFGNPSQIRFNQYNNDPGYIEHYRFDSLGNMYFKYSNTGMSYKFTKYNCEYSNLCPNNAEYYIKVEQSDGMEKFEFYDLDNRVVRTAESNIDERLVFVDMIYNAQGQEIEHSQPYFSDDSLSKRVTVTYYDSLSNKHQVSAFDGLTTRFSHHNGKVTQSIDGSFSTTSLNRTRVEDYNGHGHLISATDPEGAVTYYFYDAVGNISRVLGADGSETITNYDQLGRRINIIDPDLGIVEYHKNSIGEEAVIVSAGEIEVSHYRNLAGQLIKREYNSSGSDLVQNFDYGRTPFIQREFQEGYTATYSYDRYHRLFESTFSVPEEVWRSTQFYDQFSRPFRKLDILGNGSGYQYQYRKGHLFRVFDVATKALLQENSEFNVFSEASKISLGERVMINKSVDLSGRISEIQTDFSSGENVTQEYTHDQLGNLRVRQNHISGVSQITESFGYDLTNRLTNVHLNGGQSLSLSYSDEGNILSKSDLENGASYEYNTNHSFCMNQAPVHAVSSVGNRSYCYDTRGNLTSEFLNQVRISNIEYGLHNKPLSMSSKHGVTQFGYDVNNGLLHRTDVEGSNSIITYYVDGYEVIYDDNGKTIKRYIGDYVIDSSVPGGSNNIVYLVKDHLGSTSIAVNAAGEIITSASFDAFGKRRDASSWNNVADPYLQLQSLDTLRNISQNGFTGHKQIDHIGIIHMGGRIYNPQLGRFLQADPVVEDLRDSQTLNRYSYVLNNPLSYSDPTGYKCFDITSNSYNCSHAIDNLERAKRNVNNETKGNSHPSQLEEGKNGASNRTSTLNNVFDSRGENNPGGDNDWAQKAIDRWDELGTGDWLLTSSFTGHSARFAFKDKYLVSQKYAALTAYSYGTTMNSWTISTTKSSLAGSYGFDKLLKYGDIFGRATGTGGFFAGLGLNGLHYMNGNITTSEFWIKNGLDFSVYVGGSRSIYAGIGALGYGIFDATYTSDNPSYNNKNIPGFIQAMRDFNARYKPAYTNPHVWPGRSPWTMWPRGY